MDLSRSYSSNWGMPESQVNRQVTLGRDVWKHMSKSQQVGNTLSQSVVASGGNSAVGVGL